MGEKVTVMVLKVDLQCPCCYKKVKKILCKFPHDASYIHHSMDCNAPFSIKIRDQVYNEKANTVTITVVCCNPEKVRDKLCCKGAKVIKSIEIKDPPKPKEPEKPKEPAKPKEPEKPKEPVKPKEPEKPKVIVIEKPKEPQKPKVTFVEPEKPKEKPPPPAEKPAPPKEPAPAPKPSPPEPVVGPAPVPIHGYPPVFPVRTCCGQCYDGYGGGPCYKGYGHGHGYGVPPPPQPSFDGYNYGYGHDRPCHVSRCDFYFSEENPQGCSIM